MTKIEWTEQSWNPIVGCSVLSSGCTNCYAMKQANRLLDGNPATPHYEGTTKVVNGNAVWTGKVAIAPQRVLEQPLRRKKTTMYFVNSMGDLFHEDVPFEWIDRVFAIMAAAPQHTFQILTKRPERMREYIRHARSLTAIFGEENVKSDEVKGVWPPFNIWLGTSCENQETANKRIPILLDTPAALRFVSLEPLLGQIALSYLHHGGARYTDAVIGEYNSGGHCGAENHSTTHKIPKLDWVIVGGESGKGARPMHPNWVRQIRDDCASANTPFFFKQWGEWVPCSQNDGGDWFVNHANYCRLNRAGTKSETGWPMQRVGKNRAGKSIDGEMHQAIPRRY